MVENDRYVKGRVLGNFYDLQADTPLDAPVPMSFVSMHLSPSTETSAIKRCRVAGVRSGVTDFSTFRILLPLGKLVTIQLT